MKKIKYTKIAEDLGITHSAVSQWFNQKTSPTIDKVFKMEDLHNIPTSAWRDIKSFITDNNISNQSTKSTTKKQQGVA